jgi:hypothetical protein
MIATPAERHAYLAPVVSCEGWIGKCVVIVPDRELVDPIIVIGRVDLEENSRNGNLRTLATASPSRKHRLFDPKTRARSRKYNSTKKK